jgi:hypothetical protein
MANTCEGADREGQAPDQPGAHAIMTGPRAAFGMARSVCAALLLSCAATPLEAKNVRIDLADGVAYIGVSVLIPRLSPMGSDSTYLPTA